MVWSLWLVYYKFRVLLYKSVISVNLKAQMKKENSRSGKKETPLNPYRRNLLRRCSKLLFTYSNSCPNVHLALSFLSRYFLHDAVAQSIRLCRHIQTNQRQNERRERPEKRNARRSRVYGRIYDGTQCNEKEHRKESKKGDFAFPNFLGMKTVQSNGVTKLENGMRLKAKSCFHLEK